MKKRIVWLVVSCLMVAALLLASCAAAEVEEEEEVAPPAAEEEEVTPPAEEEVAPAVEKPKYGGVLIQVMTYEPRRFDSIYGHHYLSPTLYLTNEDLLTGDWAKGPAGTYQDDWVYYSKICSLEVVTGCIAESFEIPDPGTVIYHIRKGIHWHDKPPVNGRELDAYDVEYSLLRFYEHSTSFHYSNAPWDKAFESIEATDKWTVVVKGYILSDLYAQEGDHSHIYPHEMIEEYGDMDDWENSCGTGPFELIDFVAGSSATFKRFDNYWMKDPIGPGKGNQLPYLDGVKWLIIPDASTQQAALRTGKVDHLLLGWEDAESMMKTNPELEYLRWFGGATPAIFVRVDKPEFPFYDRKVRQALMMAIDNQAIVEQYYGGNAELMPWPTAPVPHLRGCYVPLEDMPEVVQLMFGHHPDKAKQLLAEAGYPDGFKTEIVCYAPHVDLLSIVKEYWAKIGVDLELDVREFGAYTGVGASKKHNEMYIYGAISCTLPKELDNVLAGQYLNWSMMNDPRIEEDYVKLSDAFLINEPEADRIMKELSPYLLEQAYLLPLPGQYVYTFWQPWLKNYHGEYSVGLANAYEWARYVWLDQDLKEEMTGTR